MSQPRFVQIRCPKCGGGEIRALAYAWVDVSAVGSDFTVRVDPSAPEYIDLVDNEPMRCGNNACGADIWETAVAPKELGGGS